MSTCTVQPAANHQRSLELYDRLARLKQFTSLAVVLTAFGWGKAARTSFRNEFQSTNPVAKCGSSTDGLSSSVSYPITNASKWNDPIEKAKYGFILKCPYDDPVFKAQWRAAIDHLHQFERGICQGISSNLFIEVDEHGEESAATSSGFKKLLRRTTRNLSLYSTNKGDPSPFTRSKEYCLAAWWSFTRDGCNVESMSAEVRQVIIAKRGIPIAPSPFGQHGIFRMPPNLAGGAAPLAGPSAAVFPSAAAAATPAPAAPVIVPTHMIPAGASSILAPGSSMLAPASAPSVQAAPGSFGAHLQPEQSPHGTHPFVFASPAHVGMAGSSFPSQASGPTFPYQPRTPKFNGAYTLPDGTVPPERPAATTPTAAQPAVAAPTVSGFSSHLQPEQSIYGTHPFIYASPAHIGMEGSRFPPPHPGKPIRASNPHPEISQDTSVVHNTARAGSGDAATARAQNPSLSCGVPVGLTGGENPARRLQPWLSGPSAAHAGPALGASPLARDHRGAARPPAAARSAVSSIAQPSTPVQHPESVIACRLPPDDSDDTALWLPDTYGTTSHAPSTDAAPEPPPAPVDTFSPVPNATYTFDEGSMMPTGQYIVGADIMWPAHYEGSAQFSLSLSHSSMPAFTPVTGAHFRTSTPSSPFSLAHSYMGDEYIIVDYMSDKAADMNTRLQTKPTPSHKNRRIIMIHSLRLTVHVIFSSRPRCYGSELVVVKGSVVWPKGVERGMGWTILRRERTRGLSRETFQGDGFEDDCDVNRVVWYSWRGNSPGYDFSRVDDLPIFLESVPTATEG
ncbi:hypothetical protein B0H11DRAFT_1914969 [Mycena galericulata]|nr:hypothetical protein B0H11DRAFT_1914969 [Mycena galericulata]